MEKTLKTIYKEAEEVAGGWNGEDAQYVVGGVTYDEDAAVCAQEIMDKAKELETLLNEFNTYGKSF